MDRVKRNAPYLLLVGALIASAVLTLALSAQLTFFGDTWSQLLSRRELSVDAVLVPHNEHIVAMQTLLQHLLLPVFGMGSATPEFVLLTIFLLAAAGLLFVYVERRLGPWPALLAAVLVLFLGPAWEVLLWPFEICFVGSVVFGLAMLLALEREDRNGDLIASVCLLVAMAFSSLGVAFAAAYAADLLLKRNSRRPLPRLLTFAIPVSLFALWYLGWGSDAETHVSLRNVLSSPRFVVEMVAFAVAGLVGLGTTPYGGVADPGWGYALLLALLAGLAYRLVRGPRLPTGFWVVGAAAAANWFLTAFNQMPGRSPTTSRYVYASAFFVLLMAANALRGTRFGSRALILAGAIALAAVSVNVVVLKDGRDWFLDQTVLTRSNLAAIEIARETVPADFQLGPEIAGTPSMVDVFAAKYLEAVDENGSPAYDEAELFDAPEVGRRQADIVLSAALPLSTETFVGEGPVGGDGCRPAVGSGTGTRLDPGVSRVEVDPGPPVSLNLRRFAEGEFPVPLRELPGESTMLLTIPPDASPAPWYLEATSQQPVAVCD